MDKINHFLNIIILLILALLSKLFLTNLINNENYYISILGIIVTFSVGVYLIKKTANIIERTTAVLKRRTGLAGGLLQSFGTAFPDMVIGVVSALLSLQVASSDPLKAVNLAIIAASTTFGSNIYNVFHAAWCVYRQNLADKLNRNVLMFPKIKAGGTVTPISMQEIKPSKREVDNSLIILTFLSLLTTSVALGMVIFGKINDTPAGINGDLYQLNRPIGIVILVICITILFTFRKTASEVNVDEGPNIYSHFSTILIWVELLFAAAIILLAAESLVEAVVKFSEITKIPFVISGVFTGIVGCLSEIIVIHNFTIHPKGRLSDAIIGIAMDNIVTTMGASFIAVLGGIFLGSDALIIIFVLILFGNTVLMQQISTLRNHL